MRAEDREDGVLRAGMGGAGDDAAGEDFGAEVVEAGGVIGEEFEGERVVREPLVVEGLGEFCAGCRAAADAEQAGYPEPEITSAGMACASR